MKTWELANTIIHDFFPALIPGRSIVVHQDFCHHYTYWIHLTMYRLRDYFEPIYDIPFSASLVYRHIKPIPEDLLKATYKLESFSEDEINAAFEYSRQWVSVDKKPVLFFGQVTALTELGAPNFKSQIASVCNSFYATYSEVSYLKFQFDQAQVKLQELQQSQSALSVAVPGTSKNPKLKQKLKTARLQIGELEAQIHRASGRIGAMESSKFWQLRTQWFRLKKTLGLPVND